MTEQPNTDRAEELIEEAERYLADAREQPTKEGRIGRLSSWATLVGPDLLAELERLYAERDAERARAEKAEAHLKEAEGELSDIDSEVPALFECYDGTDEVDEDSPVPLYDRVVALRERAEAAEARAINAEALGQAQADELAEVQQQLRAAEARVAIAEDLLKRVVIHGGAGSWTWREMYDWCCDYKDWSNGYGHEWYERPHDNCGHRKRPGTECGAIGAGNSDEPVPHLFGPDGLLKQAEAAEARVAELESGAGAETSEAPQ